METAGSQDTYAGPEGDVVLDVVVGEGHQGDIAVYLDDEPKGRGEDEVRGLVLGDAAQLTGKVVRVRVVVAPVNVQSTRSSVRCVFRSDGAGLVRDCPGPAVTDGALIRFKMDFDVG